MSRFPSTSLRPSREVRLLGADVRMARNDEPEIDRGPLTQPAELSEEDCLEKARQDADVAYLLGQQKRDARRLSETVQVELADFRARGLM